MEQPIAGYLEKLKSWAVYTLAVVLIALLSALFNKYVGKAIEIPPPPAPTVVVVTPNGESPPNIQVIQPK